jgi:uncharacterized RDD family membrane protein YckC
MNQISSYSTRHLDQASAYDNVRTRRVMGALLDFAIIIALCVPVAIVILFLGIATLGLGFALYGLMFPAMALLYSGFTLGGRDQATIGMKLMEIHVERVDGKPMDFLTAAAHTFLFWAANVILTPIVLLATLFTDRKRALHDMLTDSVVLRGAI